MLKTSAFILAAATFSLSFVGAAPANAAETARIGIARCGGNNYVRQGGTEIQKTFFSMRNEDAAQPITITRLIVINATGVLVYDSAVSGLPASSNGIIGPTNSVLAPHQSASIATNNFLPFFAQPDRPLQTVIVWSSVNPARALVVRSIRVTRGRDATTGAELEERARNGGSCNLTLIP